MRTASLDLSEMTEATLTFDMSAVELIFGRVVLYKDGLPFATLRFYNGIPTTPPACGLIYHEIVDLTAYCDDDFDDVFIAFEVFHDEPCGIPFPAYQDWILDNVVVWAQDKISPADVMVTTSPAAETETMITWTAPGDDAMLRRAELYNIRYGPTAIDATNWRHSLWIRPDMATIPVPANPGTAEFVHAVRLAGGFHHFAVVTQDEVTNRSGPGDGGVNNPPSQTAPAIVQVLVGNTLVFDVTATDPDFDPLILYATSIPTDALYDDHADGTATFTWTPDAGDVGFVTTSFEARDPNGATDTDDTVIEVLDPPPPTGACCPPTSTCTVVTPANCAAVSGVYQGNGSTCTPDPCLTSAVDGEALETVLSLQINPNPFAGSVSLRIAGPSADGAARVMIFDASGRLVRNAWSGKLTGRATTATWDGRDDAGHEVATGIYMVRLENGAAETTGRIVKLR